MADPTTIQWATLIISGVAAIGATASALYAVQAQRRHSDRERLRPEFERLAMELHLLDKRMRDLSHRYPAGTPNDLPELERVLRPTLVALDEMHPILRIYDFELGMSLWELQRELETWLHRDDEIDGTLVVKQIVYILDRVRKLLR